MGLISCLPPSWRRLHHVWSWRLRYWWLDTPAGAQAQVVICCFMALVVIAQFIHLGIRALSPAPVEQHSVIWWVVYLIVMLVAAAVSYAMRPKPESAKPTQAQGPTTDDGQSVIRYWGTHWVDDEFILAHKIVGRDPIKASGGK